MSAPSPHFHMEIIHDSVSCTFPSLVSDSNNHSGINLASKHRGNLHNDELCGYLKWGQAPSLL